MAPVPPEFPREPFANSGLVAELTTATVRFGPAVG